MFYAEEVFALVYTYIGKPEKTVVGLQANAYWAGSGGTELRKQGFKDAIYVYGYRDEEYGLYSCAEKKWYSGITVYLKAKGLPTG